MNLKLLLSFLPATLLSACFTTPYNSCDNGYSYGRSSHRQDSYYSGNYSYGGYDGPVDYDRGYRSASYCPPPSSCDEPPRKKREQAPPPAPAPAVAPSPAPVVAVPPPPQVSQQDIVKMYNAGLGGNPLPPR